MDKEQNSLARRTNETGAIEKSSSQPYTRDTRIVGWLEIMSQLTRQEVPEGPALELWFRCLSSYLPSLVDAAFEDYAANGSDEKDHFWFPVPAQIVARCARLCEHEEGKPAKSELAQIDQWKREQASMSPEEQAAYDAEVEQVREAVRKLGRGHQAGAEMTEAEWKERKRRLQQQACEITEKQKASGE